MARRVLLDNFTLQGAHGYVFGGERARLHEQCLALLLESAVVYDQIVVPKDVLERNQASQTIAKMLPRVIVGESLPLTPDIHHHVVDFGVLDALRPSFAGDRNPFSEFLSDADHAAELIDRIGHPIEGGPGWMGRNEPRLKFEERHAYHTWFCVMLSAHHGVNYAPNPTRQRLLTQTGFLRAKAFPDFQKTFMEHVEQARQEYNESLRKSYKELVDLVRDVFEFPLVYSFLRSKARNVEAIISEALKLRGSKEAMDFRRYCNDSEVAFQQYDFDKLDRLKPQLEEVRKQWSSTLQQKKRRQILSIGLPPLPWLSTSLSLPLPSIGLVDRKPHFLFIHKMLRGTYRRRAA